MGPSDNHNLLYLVFVNLVHNLVESPPLQKLVCEHYSVSFELHAWKPVEELRVQLLLTAMGDYNSFRPKLNLNVACVDDIKSAGTATSSAFLQNYFSFFPRCSCDDVPIWKELNRGYLVQRIENFSLELRMDVVK